MQSFYFLFICLLILLYIPKNSFQFSYSKSINIVYILVFPFLVAFFLGLRNQNIGLDSINYIMIFKDPSSYPFKLESGFLLLNRIISIFSQNANFYLYIISYLICFIQVLSYYKLCREDCFFCLLLFCCFYYFYQFHLNIMRQGLAIVIVTFAYSFYIKKQKFLFFIVSLLAISFHTTAIIFLMYPLFSIKYTKKKMQFFLLVLLFFLMFTNITSIVIANIPNFHWSIDKLKTYYYLSFAPVKIKQTHLISFAIIIFFTINFDKIKDTKFYYLYTFHTVFFVFLAFFHECYLVYDRFYFYLQIFEPILIYEFRNIFKEKRIYNIFIVIFVLLMSVFTIYIWGPRNFLSPYFSMFQKM